MHLDTGPHDTASIEANNGPDDTASLEAVEEELAMKSNEHSQYGIDSCSSSSSCICDV